MANPVVHFEVSAKDAAAQREFYTSVFGWDTTVHEGSNYTMLDTGARDGGIDGGLGQNEHGQSFVTVYIQVDDLQAYLDKAASYGATPIMPPMESPTQWLASMPSASHRPMAFSISISKL